MADRTITAHVDTFAREHLPPPDLWPALDLGALPELARATRLNAAAELLDRRVAAGAGERIAIRYPAAEQCAHWTYAELHQQANRMANVLVARYRLVPGNRVLLRAPNHPMLAAWWFAVLKAGGIAVSTMPLLRARELRHILEHARVDVAVTDARVRGELDAAVSQTGRDIPVIAVGGGQLESAMAAAPAAFESVETAATDVAIIAYTSGTTGNAKGTAHFHRDLMAACECWSTHTLQPHADDVFCGSPPLAFTYGLGGLVLFPLHVGASTLLVEQTSPPQLLDAITRYRPTILFTSPTGYRAMLERLPEFDVSSLRTCVSAGEALPLGTFDAWRQATGLEIVDGIGSTELLHIFISAAGTDIRPGSTGKAVYGYEARVVDEAMREVERGTIGRLAVRGPTGCRYLSDEQRQRGYVRDGWNLTGDAYVQDADGYFWYQARADDMIVSAGYNISGPEVENVLLEHPSVLECAVVAAPDAVRGHIVKAFVVLRAGHVPGDALVEELRAFVKAQIAPYKCPRAIEFVGALPRTNTGKLQRFKLRESEKAAP